MNIEFATRRKILSALVQIDNLLLADFPHDASRQALLTLRDFFQSQSDRLVRACATGNNSTIARACITVNERLYEYLPVLGLLLRSTNVRNSFELYDALHEIAKSLIGADAKVVLSSEWDLSPLTYPMSISALPGYVLIGMPSTEASNALIIPLSGHELGHTSWITENLENLYSQSVENRAKNYIKIKWSYFQQCFPEHANISPTDDELEHFLFR